MGLEAAVERTRCLAAALLPGAPLRFVGLTQALWSTARKGFVDPAGRVQVPAGAPYADETGATVVTVAIFAPKESTNG